MIHNPTGFPHLWCQKMGGGGQIFDVLVVRGTFGFTDGVPVRPAAVQEPPIPGDELEGGDGPQPLTAVLRRAGDLLAYKPATDIHVIGTARSADEKAAAHWLAGVSVGDTVKVLRLSGPRQFRLGLWDWRLTKPEPTTAVVLDYRRAFGGCLLTPDGIATYKPDNPAGTGWLPDRKTLSALDRSVRRAIERQLSDLRLLTAPQIDDPRQPVTHPTQRLAAQGFGPIPRWCAPRADHLGTRDEQWLQTRYPEYPVDFDARFFQSAHPDLICRHHLAGDEPILLAGFLPEGRIRTSLPSVAFRVDAIGEDGRGTTHRPMLDTVCIDLDARTVALTWRITFPVDVHLREAWIRQEALGDRIQRREAA